MPKSKKYDRFIGQQVIIIIRGSTKFGVMTPDGEYAQTNSYIGYLVGYDKEDLFVSTDSPIEYTMIIRRTEVAVINLAPDEMEDMLLNGQIPVDEKDIN